MPVQKRNSLPRLADIRRAFQQQVNPRRAAASSRFFKTGEGQYGAGDKFLGLTVPQQRQIVRQFRLLPLADVLALLRSPYHEHRLTAVLLLVWQYDHGTTIEQARITKAYLASRRYLNNWDIIDSSAPHILGRAWVSVARPPFERLISSRRIWDRRIAILTTQAFIRQGRYSDTLKLVEYVLRDEHDLIHKAAGWMLREIGDRDEQVLRKFLRRYARKMPRTMLRYAIEHLRDRKQWLAA